MPPLVIDVRKADDLRDVVHRAVQTLAEGKLVAVPTETVYGLAASAMLPEAIDRLCAVKGRDFSQPFTLAIKSAEDALDYVPHMPALARRLARRCWPGPVTLVVDDCHDDGLISLLPERSRQAVAPQGAVGLRVPAHALVLDVLRMLAGPIVLTSANRSGQSEASTSAEIVEALGDQIDLILDDGPPRYGQPSTVVRVAGKQLEVLRPGVVAEPLLRRLASFMIVFICTGNTCRSPMAEALCRKLVADRLGCEPAEIEDHGVMVASAGLGATPGDRPNPMAVEVLNRWSLSLEHHESQPLGDVLVRQADVIFTMTRSHRAALLSQWPEAAERVHLLRLDDGDVSDPIGGDFDTYLRCAEQIKAELEHRVGQLEF